MASLFRLHFPHAAKKGLGCFAAQVPASSIVLDVMMQSSHCNMIWINAAIQILHPGACIALMTLWKCRSYGVVSLDLCLSTHVLGKLGAVQRLLPSRHGGSVVGENVPVFDPPRKPVSTGSKRSYQDMDKVSKCIML